jgi:serine phosphatase RsbU (regulator of sigma subunit)/anti-sigma regulatory factor (Ser/Thr protein kinase)
MIESILRLVPLFVSLPDEELRYLAQTLRLIEATPGTILFEEGDYGHVFYIVLEGEIEIVKALGTPDELSLGLRGSGQYVGEMSLFTREGLRIATARVHSPARLFEMTRTDFEALLHRQPTIAYEMVRVLAERLNNANNKTIVSLHQKNTQLTEAYESLKAAQAQIIEQEKLKRELQVAQRVQTSLIPRCAPRLAGWDFAAHWQPARTVSGDFYDFIPLPRAESEMPECGIVMADVADKGMPAALFMAVTRSIVRASVTATRAPAEAIKQANRLVCADSHQGLFVTLFYAQLDPLTGDLAYVNAGHTPAWIHRYAAAEWLDLPRTGKPLGLFRQQTLDQQLAHLEPGDLLFLYTDGVLEATNPQGEVFGPERVRQLLLENRNLSAARLTTKLEEALQTFCGDQALFDDITFAIVKRVQPGPFTWSLATAELTHLAPIRDFVIETAEQFGADQQAVDDLVLCIDELATNIVMYGYQEQPNPIELTLWLEAGTIVVKLRDQAPPFDPTQLADPDTSLPLSARPIGGLGIFLVRRLMNSFTYQRIADQYNEVTLTKKIV